MTGAFAQYAAHMLKGGYSPVPIRPGSKRPLFDKWDHLRDVALTEDQINRLVGSNPHLGLGVAGNFNGLVPVDVDTDDKEILLAVWRALPKPVVSKVGRRGYTAFYWDGGSGMIEAAKIRQTVGVEKPQMLVEIITTGQSVIPPTIHKDTLKPYEWRSKHTLFDTPIDGLSIFTVEHFDALRAAISPWTPEQPKFRPTLVAVDVRRNGDRYAKYAARILESEARKISLMGPESGRNIALFHAACKIGKYVHHRIISFTEVENALLSACQSNGLWRDKDCGAKGCIATLHSGLRKASNDVIPQLPNRTMRRISNNHQRRNAISC